MDAHFNVEQRPYMTVANGWPTSRPTPSPTGRTFIATGSDTDGGVKTIEIWHTTDRCSLGDPDDEEVARACQALLAPFRGGEEPRSGHYEDGRR